MKIAVTGHRPKKLPGTYSQRTYNALHKTAYDWLSKREDIEEMYNGAALGWDNATLRVSISLNIPAVACVPFKGQEKKWHPLSRKDYELLLELINKVVYVDELEDYSLKGVAPGIPNKIKMHRRNEYMVDQLWKGDLLLALFDGVEQGGTWSCINYAQRKGIEVVNLWEEFNEIYNRTP